MYLSVNIHPDPALRIQGGGSGAQHWIVLEGKGQHVTLFVPQDPALALNWAQAFINAIEAVTPRKPLAPRTESEVIALRARLAFAALSAQDQALAVASWKARSEFDKDELRASIALDLL